MALWRLPVLDVLAAGFPGACSSDNPPAGPLPLTAVVTDRSYIRDGHGRHVPFHGVNVSGSNTVAAFKEVEGGTVADRLFKPFPLDAAEDEFAKLRDFGFDSVRLLLLGTPLGQQERASTTPPTWRTSVRSSNRLGAMASMSSWTCIRTCSAGI